MTRDGSGAGEPVVDWLLTGDPAIRWQTMRDLLDAPEDEWAPVRALVESEGWGAALLACQSADGLWAGGTFAPADFSAEAWEREGQPWTATAFVLNQLREFGLPPQCPSAQRTVRLIGENGRWDEGDQPFWDGEVEECINARTIADGAYFGVDVRPIVERILTERQDDGGWNCDRERGSRRASFDTTINVLEALLEFELATGARADVTEARSSGEEFLLSRALFRRLSTGEVTSDEYLQLSYPRRWQYDVLRGLDYFRRSAIASGRGVDPRLDDALAHVRGRRTADGRWLLDSAARGRVWFEMEKVGEPSR